VINDYQRAIKIEVFGKALIERFRNADDLINGWTVSAKRGAAVK
jgi:hypothetical protein